MQRTIDYVIPSFTGASAPMTVKGFLKSKGYSVQNLKILKFSPDGITQDGIPVHLNHVLSEGSLLTVRIREDEASENILPVKLPLNILYEDEDLIVLDKPAGMPTHPSQNNRDNTLANALAYYYHEKGEPFIFRCISRLDRDTSGLTVVAKHYVSAGILGAMVSAKSEAVLAGIAPSEALPDASGDITTSEAFPANAQDITASEALPDGTRGIAKPGALRREYLAIVKGHVTPPAGVIDAPLGRKPGSVIERCIDFENGQRAVTHYRVTEEKNGYSLVSLILETGRTHQIRIHMKYLGFPLIGDYLYNPDMEKISRQALHSCRLSFCHPMSGIPMDFTAPLPADMQSILS